MTSEKVLISWSGGKDCALALHQLHGANGYEIVGLLTTLTTGYDRVSMHGVRRSLLESQATALGYPLHQVLIPQECSEEEYSHMMRSALEPYLHQDVQVVFGDLFLEDVRSYRQERLAQVGMTAIFPVWKIPTRQLANLFIEDGFRAIVACVDTEQLDGSFAGREYDEAFLADLPDGVDPCGENGEFHTFVYDGPLFAHRIGVQKGEKVLRDERFYYCDLLPLSN